MRSATSARTPRSAPGLAPGLSFAFGAGLSIGSAMAGQTIGPLPYLSAANSPFDTASAAYFHLEDFEDDALNTPGVSVSGTWTLNLSTTYIDSVDGDDGAIDGTSQRGQGKSLYSNLTETEAVFTFDASTLGGLPTFAGVVWTDVGRNGGGVTTTEPARVVFSARDASGAVIGATPPVELGDRLITSQTEEDRFFGIVHPQGIASITLAMPGYNNWELDHLQYGRHTVAAPTAIAPLGNASAPSAMSWTASPGATWYYVYVDDASGPRERRWVTATQAGCVGGTGTCTWPVSGAAVGTTRWWTRAWNATSGPWSLQATWATPSETVPGAATPVWPKGPFTRVAPTLVWQAAPGATWYRTWVQSDATNDVTSDWYTAASVGCADGTGTCALETTANLRNAHTWWVQTWSPAGYGPWSVGVGFSD